MSEGKERGPDAPRDVEHAEHPELLQRDELLRGRGGEVLEPRVAVLSRPRAEVTVPREGRDREREDVDLLQQLRSPPRAPSAVVRVEQAPQPELVSRDDPGGTEKKAVPVLHRNRRRAPGPESRGASARPPPEPVGRQTRVRCVEPVVVSCNETPSLSRLCSSPLPSLPPSYPGSSVPLSLLFLSPITVTEGPVPKTERVTM